MEVRALQLLVVAPVAYGQTLRLTELWHAGEIAAGRVFARGIEEQFDDLGIRCVTGIGNPAHALLGVERLAGNNRA